MKKTVLFLLSSLFIINVCFASSAALNEDLATTVFIGSTTKVEELLKAGADPNTVHQASGMPLLIAACATQKNVMAELLINAGANVNVKAHTGGFTPLHFAAMQNNVALVKLLLDKGADPTIMDNTGKTPVSLALMTNNRSMANLLTNKYKSDVITNTVITSADTDLIILDQDTLLQAKSESEKLKDIGDWNRQVAYFLGAKSYDFFTNASPQRVQLITPYSMARYAYYKSGVNYLEPNPAVLKDILSKNDTVWVWIWSDGAYDHVTKMSRIGVTNVVVKVGNEIHQPSGKLLAAFNVYGVPEYQLYSFPISVFKKSNTPFEIIIIDAADKRKPFKVTADMFDKIK